MQEKVLNIKKNGMGMLCLLILLEAVSVVGIAFCGVGVSKEGSHTGLYVIGLVFTVLLVTLIIPIGFAGLKV